MFGLLLPLCGLAAFPSLPKRTVSEQHITFQSLQLWLGWGAWCSPSHTVIAGGEGGFLSQRDPLTPPLLEAVESLTQFACSHTQNARHCHSAALSVNVDCLEKVIPLYLYLLVVPGTTFWDSRLLFHCHPFK